MLYYLCISVPSGAPQNLAIINSTSTSVTISWDSVECIHRNGLITHYNISYGPVGDTNLVKTVTVNSDEPDDGGSYTATGLERTQNYLFKVAAVNVPGVGVFATVFANKCKQYVRCELWHKLWYRYANKMESQLEFPHASSHGLR